MRLLNLTLRALPSSKAVSLLRAPSEIRANSKAVLKSFIEYINSPLGKESSKLSRHKLSKYSITSSTSANSPPCSTNKHCLIVLAHPPFSSLTSRFKLLVLNLVRIDTTLFLIILGALPENNTSSKHLAIISFF